MDSSPSIKQKHESQANWAEPPAASSSIRLEVEGDGHDHSNDEPIYFTGARFYLLWASLIISLFLANIEIPIVTTSIVTITDDLGGFDRASWITSAYLLGFVGVLIVWSKLSDIFGRKLLYGISLALFIIFSAACGAAQTLTQLIIFRAFQGIGGGGSFAVCNVIGFELVPEAKYAAITGFVAFVYAISLIIGPLVGGAISKSSQWRWVFLLNVPAAIPALLILLFYLPNNFPHHGKPNYRNQTYKNMFSTKNLARVDIVGVIFIWLGVMALVAGLEEAGILHEWDAPFVIAMLVIGGILCLSFLAWEWYVTQRLSTTEPVFPWRFATSRVMLGLFLCALSQGIPWIGALFQLPQKFQTVHAQSPIASGVKTIPFTGAAPIASITTAIIAKKGVPPIYLVLFASILQVIGFALLATLPLSSTISKAQYGYQVIAGFGCGTNSSLLILMAPLSVRQQKDKSVAIGGFNQFRFMGGAIGLAIISTAMTGFIRPRLSDILAPSQVDLVLKSAEALKTLGKIQRNQAVAILADGYNLQFKILAGLSGLQIIGAGMMWQKNQIKAT
ncbi:MFS multidrug transporter-like protein [Periconia macrospinosa]|uniref:MFS multidrug transporter-like protein n=1 Tax=Periconia macrospinosa TaxID=97972 RepID=A0A2V1D6G6_9PLEO|nr:MFS multidrug transporter-like protein [Periconia macrospinosa]